MEGHRTYGVYPVLILDVILVNSSNGGFVLNPSKYFCFFESLLKIFFVVFKLKSNAGL